MSFMSGRMWVLVVVLLTLFWGSSCNALRAPVPSQNKEELNALSGFLLMECPEEGARVCAVDFASGGRTRILTEDCRGNCLEPSLSPSADEVAFAQWSEEGGDIWRVNFDGTGKKRLLQTEGVRASPAWSPDGSMLAYCALRDPYILPHTEVQSYHKAALYVTGDSWIEEQLTPWDGKVLYLDWAPDSSQLVISARLQDLNGNGTIGADDDDRDPIRLYLVDPVTREVQPVFGDITPEDRSMYLPSWSPGGRYIAYVEGYGDADGDLVVAEVMDHSEVARIELDAGADYQWSPDGESIAYVGYSDRSDRGLYVDVFVWDMVTSTAKRLTRTSLYSVHSTYDLNGISLDSLVWSPDGEYLAFLWASQGKDYVVVASVDGSQLFRVSGPGTYYSIVAWDGRDLSGK